MTNILIADDDINVLKLIDIHLRKEGYRVFQAKDGMEALQLFDKETCDLAVIDVMMPYMDGYELTKRAAQAVQHSHHPVNS